MKEIKLPIVFLAGSHTTHFSRAATKMWRCPKNKFMNSLLATDCLPTEIHQSTSKISPQN
jgi:phage FluMu protein Com